MTRNLIKMLVDLNPDLPVRFIIAQEVCVGDYPWHLAEEYYIEEKTIFEHDDAIYTDSEDIKEVVGDILEYEFEPSLLSGVYAKISDIPKAVWDKMIEKKIEALKAEGRVYDANVISVDR